MDSVNREIFEIVNPSGEVLGTAPRVVAHGSPLLMHRVVHVIVIDEAGRILLQKRAMTKDVAPGRWDTSVGGHVDLGEAVIEAALREMHEELGFECDPAFLYSYTHSNAFETELVNTFSCVYSGLMTFNPEEIDEIRFWGLDEIKAELDGDNLSDNFKDEFKKYLAHIAAP